MSDTDSRRDTRPWLRFPSSALIASLLALPLYAQEATEEDEPAGTYREEVTVEETLPSPYTPAAGETATKIATPKRLTPVSLSSVSDAVLDAQDARILGDALENVAGMTAHVNGGGSDLFYIRGFESLSSSGVYTDGALEPEASLYRMYNVERVEVVRGPLGFLYGGSPLAGAVNLVRKQPAPRHFGSVDLSFGTHATSQATFDVNHGSDDGRFAFRINGLYTDTDGYRDDRESTTWAINPTFAYKVSDRTTVTVNTEFQDDELASDSGLPLLNGSIAPVPRTRSYQSPFDGIDRETTRLRLDVETRFSPRFTLRNKTYYTEFDERSRGTIIAGAFDGSPFFPVLVGRLLADLDDRQVFAGHQIDALFELGSGTVTHDLVVGFEAQRLTDDFTLGFFNLPVITLQSPIETATEPLQPIPFLGSAGDAETTVLAPYVLDTIHIGDRWHLSLGARFDSIVYEDTRVGFESSDDQVSPFGGILFAPNDRWSFYANYGESFSPPSTTTAADGRAPEEGQQVELGVKAELWDGRLQGSLAFYRLDKDNIPIVDGTGFLSQAGDQRSEGFELELGGRVSDDIDWLFSYAYTDAELVRFTEVVFDPATGFPFFLDFSGNDPAWVPEHVADLWITKRFASGLIVAGGARYVGERFLDEDNIVALDDYTTLDAMVSYTRGGMWTARVQLRNLTDEDYEIRGLGAQSVLPADGLHLLGGIRLDF